MTDPATVDVLVVGDLNPDLVVTGATLDLIGGQVEQDAEIGMTLGGSGGIVAAGLTGLGLRTALCACVGEDDLGRAAQRMLAAAGVRVDAIDVLPDRHTGISVHLLAGQDRAIYTDRGAMIDLRIEEALRWLRVLQPRHVHLCSLYLIPALIQEGRRLVDAAHAAGATISADPNFDPTQRFEVPEWLTRVDALMPNETEALRLTGRPPGTDIQDAARDLAADGALVAIKCGARGAIAVHGTRYAEAQPGAEITVVDAVGAGDSFDAGLIRAVLDGRGLADALAFACACGTLSTRAAGGTMAQPSLAEALETR
ncbi:MAG: carbohydrate kinase family protein [Pseudonocardiales bacterium]|nr:MAG: carbohydrate kinase family protein [Pseudonocardiales bacterium]